MGLALFLVGVSREVVSFIKSFRISIRLRCTLPPSMPLNFGSVRLSRAFSSAVPLNLARVHLTRVFCYPRLFRGFRSLLHHHRIWVSAVSQWPLAHELLPHLLGHFNPPFLKRPHILLEILYADGFQ